MCIFGNFNTVERFERGNLHVFLPCFIQLLDWFFDCVFA